MIGYPGPAGDLREEIKTVFRQEIRQAAAVDRRFLLEEFGARRGNTPEEVDAVMVGMGWTGAIMAREFTEAGLNVVGLERGQDHIPGNDFMLPNLRDELRYAVLFLS